VGPDAFDPAVISTSFADIFRNNSLKNGLIPIVVDEETHKMLLDFIEEVPNAEFAVDLETQTLSFSHGSVKFASIRSIRLVC
jgi:3-isopropylmalate/(R)-2-methylmalate dehydratase small subunit